MSFPPSLPASLPVQPRVESSGESISSNWREIVALAGVVTAICGFAAAFFSGIMWAYSTAFAILSLTSLVHWRSARAQAQWDRFASSVQQLDLSHRQLQASEQRLNLALTQIRTEQETLTHNIGLLRQENESLVQANVTMRQLNQNLQSNNQQLQISKHSLQQQKEALETQIQLFNENNLLLKDQVHQLQLREVEMERTTGAAHSVSQDLSRLGNQLSRDNRSIRRGLSDLSLLITVPGEPILSPLPSVQTLDSPLRRLNLTIASMAGLPHFHQPEIRPSELSNRVTDAESYIREEEEYLNKQEETSSVEEKPST